MTKPLLITLAALFLFPSSASAATAFADVELEQGAPVGRVNFKGAKGEVNRVTVTAENGRLRFHDDRNRVSAKGDCEQAGPSTAICPFTENVAIVALRDRDDSATVEGLVRAIGGRGDDLLRGSGGVDILTGRWGADTLRGRGGNDNLDGGPGSDYVAGGSGDDDIAASSTGGDVYRGGASRDTAGSDRGDLISYEGSDRDLDIDLSRKKVMKGGRDDIAGFESVEGGSGNDTLAGDGDDNLLQGNDGKDNVHGRGGDDITMGGDGRDSVAGEAGDDVVWGNDGDDRKLTGGKGDDLIDGDDGTDPNSETISCGPGNDDARVTRLDRLEDCEIATRDSLYVQVQPDINGNTATFQVACQELGGCDGALLLRGPQGEDFGEGAFTDLPDDPQTFTPVSVTLTPAGVNAIAEGVVVQVAFGDVGGYRAFMKS